NNIGFGLKARKFDKAEIETRVMAAVKMLGITSLLDRLPRQLSGGQRQRVAIGRAIVRGPEVFLFDEPLSNLDAELRVEMRVEIARLHREIGATMIYVTHDQVEAMTLADRIVVLSAGRIEQVGSPIELYERPANLFVAKFIGSPAMNILPGAVVAPGEATAVRLPGGSLANVPIATAAGVKDEQVSLGVRPEDLTLAEGSDAIITGTISLVESLGEVTLLYIDAGSGGEPVVAKLPGTRNFRRGETVRLAASADKLHPFDGDGISLKRA
ncbi:MAG TPA: TOBE domain-containing protein, partial [Rhizobiaceae bacterium]|nr:TOBE domain-containing protein [Rhizobiaceae bacterium]